jgi:hypothetical protein
MAINNFNVGVGTTSQLTRYRYVATGGETSVSGTDADGKTLSYTVGLEQVFLNGVNLVRGQDYTATNGTSVGSLTALVASDVVEVFAFVPFNIANALTVSTVDAKGDLLVGTGADAVGRLAVGSTKGQLLSVDSSTASGLAWINPGMTLISTTTIGSAVNSVIVSSCFSATYENYRLVINNGTAVSGDNVAFNFKLRTGATSSSTGYYGVGANAGTGSLATFNQANTTSFQVAAYDDTSPTLNASIIDLFQPFTATATKIFSTSTGTDSTATAVRGFNLQGYHNVTTSYESIEFIITSGTITGGTIRVYGYNN